MGIADGWTVAVAPEPSKHGGRKKGTNTKRSAMEGLVRDFTASGDACWVKRYEPQRFNWSKEAESDACYLASVARPHGVTVMRRGCRVYMVRGGAR